MPIAMISSRGRLTLPKEIRKHLHVAKGDQIDFQIKNGEVWIRKLHSILELKGLGKEIWQGIDAVEYVRAERDSWDS